MAIGDPGTITFSTETVGGGSLGATAAVPQAGVQGGGVAPLQAVRSGSDWFAGTGGMTMPDRLKMPRRYSGGRKMLCFFSYPSISGSKPASSRQSGSASPASLPSSSE